MSGAGRRSKRSFAPDRAGRAQIAPARRCAYAVVRRVFEQGAYADRALQSEAGLERASRSEAGPVRASRSEGAPLDARDRALAMRLAYGAIQRRGTLDHLIEQLGERPPERLDPELLAALRLGLYELLYLDGAPDRAVVADAVELAKRAHRGGHGLVNAVLRRAAREGREALLGGLREDTPEHAALTHSHPVWIAQMWWEQLGPDQARALMAADNEPGELALRVNTLRADPQALAAALGLSPAADPMLPEALVIEGTSTGAAGKPFDLHASAHWRRGELVAQSRAAMLAARVLDPQPGEQILDLCAAPGGKTSHIAALTGDRAQIVAVERNPARAAELRDTLDRTGVHGARVELADAATPRGEGPLYDRVLLDAPCSGLGTLQSRPDLRWRITPQRVAELAALQARMLAAAASAVRPGGVLVYSTCTISAAENQLQIESFLLGDRRFALESPRHAAPIQTHTNEPALIQTLPHRDHTAGFFIAHMRRIDDSHAGRL